MAYKYKSAAKIHVKAGPDDGLAEGEFTAYASKFDNIDSYGDKIIKGAFEKTLAEWAASDDFIPVLFGHNMTDPDYNLGHIISAVEDEKGLLVHGKLDLENAKSKQVYRLLKGKRIRQLSFAYDVVEGGWIDSKDEGKYGGYYELRELKLYEVSLVTIGANQETEVLGVKSHGNRPRFKSNDEILTAITQIEAVIEEMKASLATESDESDEDGEDEETAKAGTASTGEPVKAEESFGTKAEEPKRTSASSLSAAELEIQLLAL